MPKEDRIYSLQNLFSNANLLRAKYGYDPECFTLEVQSQLIERQGLELVIVLRDGNGKYGVWAVVAFGKRPESVLERFECQLAKDTGKILDDVIFKVDEQEEDEQDNEDEQEEYDL
jgi:hypothetical protein